MPQRLRELVRFGLVGGFNAATYFGLYTAGVLAGVPYLLSAVIAFVLSASVGYWLHEHWTFKGHQPTLRGWASWIAAQAGATGLNIGLLVIAVDALGAGAILAQLVLMPVSPVATYLIGRRWVFTPGTAASEPGAVTLPEPCGVALSEPGGGAHGLQDGSLERLRP